jgi:hypothetical protein
MRLDPFGFLMEDRADRQIALQRAERLVDPHELQVVVPDFQRIGLDQIAAQMVWRQCAVQIEPLQNTGIVVEPPAVNGPL